jgi:N-acetylmuramic acid 6-phosphate (MurNAc-6-P) etherase
MEAVAEIPFTERPNPLSASLDGSLPATTFLKILRACDAQIFSGFEGQNCIFDAPILDEIDRLSCVSASYFQSGDGCVIFGGCGTSGRIGYLVAERFNQILEKAGFPALFSYCCAGGDSALLLSDELPEDSPTQGLQDYGDAVLQVEKRTSKRMRNACYVAITCGNTTLLSSFAVLYNVSLQVYQLRTALGPLLPQLFQECLVQFNRLADC